MEKQQQKEANTCRERREETGRQTGKPRVWPGGGCRREARSMSQPLFQVPSQPIFLSLTGNGFADPGLFSGVSAREAGGVWRSAYLPLDQAVCLSPCDVSVWINGGGVAAGMGFTGLCSEPYCSPWARPKCHPIHARRLAGKYGGQCQSLAKGPAPRGVYGGVYGGPVWSGSAPGA